VPAASFRSLSSRWTIEAAENAAGTSSRHDGTAAQKLDLLEERQIGRSPLHDSPVRARMCLHGDNVNLITKQECDNP
jgi:hypothetical protein